MGINDACDYTGLGRTSVYRLGKAGEIEFVQVLGRTMITVESLDAFVARCRAAGHTISKTSPSPKLEGAEHVA
ncbi:helix-turn-helix domain-containing protein [Methylocystis sp. FS]|nr:helix-turn-helix domain-containing protein [Methylocystis silviterrae]